MTRNRDFKTLVRRRMARTGERYSTARAHVLAARANGSSAGIAHNGQRPSASDLFPTVTSVGGEQGDLAAARNLCTNTGVTGPDGRRLTEAMAFGLAGGVGFLYGVFEYDDTPTMTIVARNQSMPDPFCGRLFDRLGVPVEVTTTTGAKKAAADLDAAIHGGRPALCTVGAGRLPYLGGLETEAAMSPHLVGVIGATDDATLLIDDRSPHPIPVDRADFDAARAANRPAKHRMVVASAGGWEAPAGSEWARTLEAAVAEAVAGFDRPPVPQFASNVGLAGLAKWHDLLTSSAKKGWPTVFGADRRAAIGLTRIYDCTNYAYTAPDAGRPLFARFLNEAAEVAGRPEWAEVAQLWADSGTAWRRMSDAVLAAHPDIERFGELSDRRADVLDSGGQPNGDADGMTAISVEAMAALTNEQIEIVDGFRFGADEAADVYRQLAGIVADIVEMETEALNRLR
jgi:hypothetical protein